MVVTATYKNQIKIFTDATCSLFELQENVNKFCKKVQVIDIFPMPRTSNSEANKIVVRYEVRGAL